VLWQKFRAHTQEIFSSHDNQKARTYPSGLSGRASLVFFFPSLPFPSLYLEVPDDNPAHFGILSTPFRSRRCTIDRARQGSGNASKILEGLPAVLTQDTAWNNC
jgi:hypothetical protein